MLRPPRRRVDWVLIKGTEPARASLVSPSGQASRIAHITSALLGDSSPNTVDRVLRETVEFVRTSMGLDRVAIYLVAPGRHSMVGTWGTDAAGATSDEHGLMYGMNVMVENFFALAAKGYAWSLYVDCPLLTHDGRESRTIGRGWNAYTVIPGAKRPLGILFNDSAISRAPVDETKQAQVALVCALLGRALEPCLAQYFDPKRDDGKPQHPLIRDIVHLLASDPSMSFAAVAKSLGVSKDHLTRTFRRFADVSIVDYRNELRLAQVLNDMNEKTLKQAAKDAGFGSYIQFHRVFRARFGKTPRQYQSELRRQVVRLSYPLS